MKILVTSGTPLLSDEIVTAPYISMEQHEGALALRLFDDELAAVGVVGFADRSWLRFEVIEPAGEHVVKLMEARHEQADRGTGMHL